MYSIDTDLIQYSFPELQGVTHRPCKVSLVLTDHREPALPGTDGERKNRTWNQENCSQTGYPLALDKRVRLPIPEGKSCHLWHPNWPAFAASRLSLVVWHQAPHQSRPSRPEWHREASLLKLGTPPLLSGTLSQSWTERDHASTTDSDAHPSQHRHCAWCSTPPQLQVSHGRTPASGKDGRCGAVGPMLLPCRPRPQSYVFPSASSRDGLFLRS